MFSGVPAFAALADDTRMQIVETLAAGERSVNDLVDLFPISQPAISRHLRLPREAGVVEVAPAGKQRIYRLRSEAVTEVADWATHIRRTWEARFDALGAHLDDMKGDHRA
jgi:DNA-binding transcriptional ArsR family regulator